MIMLNERDFERLFPDDRACKDYIIAKRWPDGVRCPRCNRKEKIYALKARPYHWVCCNPDCGKRAGYRFSVTTATIFQDTKVSLRIWFKIGYLMLTAKKGISSLQVRRVIFGEDSGTDWRTAWYICHRWRACMRGDAFPLTGEVEVDETYIGGRDRNRHWRKKSAQQRVRQAPATGLEKTGAKSGYGKAGVIGAIERKGNVVARVIGDMDAPTLGSFVRRTVSERVSLLATDEHPAYKFALPHAPHETVKHGRGEYVRGNVHTNNIESFWSLLKRGVVGTYHKVSKDYLPLYLNEFSFRFNNRDNADIFGAMVATCGQ
jgi:IS1 family transposase